MSEGITERGCLCDASLRTGQRPCAGRKLLPAQTAPQVHQQFVPVNACSRVCCTTGAGWLSVLGVRCIGSACIDGVCELSHEQLDGWGCVVLQTPREHVDQRAQQPVLPAELQDLRVFVALSSTTIVNRAKSWFRDLATAAFWSKVFRGCK